MQLNDANDIVNEEIHRLDHNADAAFETVNARFQTVLDNVERRRQEVIYDSYIKLKKDVEAEASDFWLHCCRQVCNF